MANELTILLETFKQNSFDPNVHSEVTIPDQSGNYIICLKSNSELPTVSINPSFTNFKGLKVVYTGIASGSLRRRDYRQHFKGNNAGRSTLRKSLGVLFGYKLIPRDKDLNTGKTKFELSDENKLSDWMCQNLMMFFLPTTNFVYIEISLINHFNPPLNLKDNHNSISSDFRKLLTALRNGKVSVVTQNINTITEGNQIPHDEQTDGAVKQMRISLLSAGKQRKKAMEKKVILVKNTKTEKTSSNATTIVRKKTSSLKKLLYAIAIPFLIASYNEYKKLDTVEFSIGLLLFYLISGVILFIKATRIKPITETIYIPKDISFYQNSSFNKDSPAHDVLNIINSKRKSVEKSKREFDIYGAAYDAAGDGIEDEARLNLDYHIEERQNYRSNDRKADKDDNEREIGRDY